MSLLEYIFPNRTPESYIGSIQNWWLLSNAHDRPRIFFDRLSIYSFLMKNLKSVGVSCSWIGQRVEEFWPPVSWGETAS